jgi:hypothetical protein
MKARISGMTIATLADMNRVEHGRVAHGLRVVALAGSALFALACNSEQPAPEDGVHDAGSQLDAGRTDGTGRRDAGSAKACAPLDDFCAQHDCPATLAAASVQTHWNRLGPRTAYEGCGLAEIFFPGDFGDGWYLSFDSSDRLVGITSSSDSDDSKCWGTTLGHSCEPIISCPFDPNHPKPGGLCVAPDSDAGAEDDAGQ